MLHELKAEISGGPTGRSGYSTTVRRRAVAWARRQQAAGRPLRAVAADLGISHETLRRWAKHGVSTFRRVKVAEAAVLGPPSAGIVLRLPGGATIEGLSAVDVAAVIRGLS